MGRKYELECTFSDGSSKSAGTFEVPDGEPALVYGATVPQIPSAGTNIALTVSGFNRTPVVGDIVNVICGSSAQSGIAIGKVTAVDSTNATCNITSFVNTTGATGAQGPKGDTGGTGPQGPAGEEALIGSYTGPYAPTAGSMIATYVSSYNRTPILNEKCILQVIGNAQYQGRSFLVYGTVTNISGNSVAVTANFVAETTGKAGTSPLRYCHNILIRTHNSGKPTCSFTIINDQSVEYNTFQKAIDALNTVSASSLDEAICASGGMVFDTDVFFVYAVYTNMGYIYASHSGGSSEPISESDVLMVLDYFYEI